jgi:hypothetical protein
MEAAMLDPLAPFWSVLEFPADAAADLDAHADVLRAEVQRELDALADDADVRAELAALLALGDR